MLVRQGANRYLHY